MDTKASATYKELTWYDMIILMAVEMIHKPGCDDLVPDALSRREELITPRLFMLVENELNDVKNDFLNDVREAMKHDEAAVTNNRLFD